MAIVIESVTESNFPSDTTSHAVPMPATVSAGNALIAIITNDGSATITTPSGWTQLYTLANGTALRGGAYAKVASGSEGGTTVDFVTSAVETLAAQVYRISGWAGAIAGIEAATPGSVTTGTTADPPALAPSWGSAATMWLATCHTSTTQTVSTGPTSYTDLTQTTSGSGTTHSQCISARRSNTTASEDPDVFTLSGTGASKVYSTIGIAPITTVESTGSSSGAGTATGASATTNSVIGSSSGVAAVSGVSGAKAGSVGSSSGVAAALGITRDPINSKSVGYIPALPPMDQRNFNQYVYEELLRVSQAIEVMALGHIPVTYVQPLKPYDGMKRYADGIYWNPGSGEGEYMYYNSTWNKLG